MQPSDDSFGETHWTLIQKEGQVNEEQGKPIRMEGPEQRQEHVITQDDPKTRNPMASFSYQNTQTNTLVVLVMSCFDDGEKGKQSMQSEFRRLPTLEQNSEKETSPWRSLI